jgi:hypothetical protein
MYSSECGCSYLMQRMWFWLPDRVFAVVAILSICGCGYLMQLMWLWLPDAVDVVVVA